MLGDELIQLNNILLFILPIQQKQGDTLTKDIL